MKGDLLQRHCNNDNVIALLSNYVRTIHVACMRLYKQQRCLHLHLVLYNFSKTFDDVVLISKRKLDLIRYLNNKV